VNVDAKRGLNALSALHLVHGIGIEAKLLMALKSSGRLLVEEKPECASLKRLLEDAFSIAPRFEQTMSWL
jgi:hypothetical protein